MTEERHLPIKIVIPSKKDIRKPESTGGPRKIFCNIDSSVCNGFVRQISDVNKYFEPVFRRYPNLPAVAKIILKEDALAKSHRPTGLLNNTTCPIIGVRKIGELLVSIRPQGLSALSSKFQRKLSKSATADISTIKQIEPYSELDAIGPYGYKKLDEYIEKGVDIFKLRLFRHSNRALDGNLRKELLNKVSALGLGSPDNIHYSSGIRIFRIRGVTSEKLRDLAKFVGTRSISTFPRYKAIKTSAHRVNVLSIDDFPPPQEAENYPTVGIIDTGIDPSNRFLAPWIVRRHEYVATANRSHEHGNFVSGLVIHPRLLNQSDPRFPNVHSRVVDVMAVPGVGSISEDELLTILEEVIPKHSEVKVWNLSLGLDDPCVDYEFSELAIALDELQDRYNVTFVFAAGNYEIRPYRGWPPEDLGEDDRICSPADSVRGLTVGAIAHRDTPNSRVRIEQPSPYTRRGPGPVFIPKPEVSHYGGNCDRNGNYRQMGILSIDGAGNLAEAIGTSFSAPIVASLFANVQNVVAGTLSRTLAKALLIHSCVLDGTPVKARTLKYRGFGVPPDLLKILNCPPWAATLIFELELVPGIEFERWPFPIPNCLRIADDIVQGDIAMTLVYDPPINAEYGAEYCRANVDVSLGTYDVDSNNKRHHQKKIPPEPQDISRLYERYLIEHGFKWSPVKVYRRSMRRLKGKDWRLKITVNHRSGFYTARRQPLALVITIMDPNKEGRVYDEVVRNMNRLGWSTVDLQVQERIRSQLR